MFRSFRNTYSVECSLVYKPALPIYRQHWMWFTARSCSYDDNSI